MDEEEIFIVCKRCGEDTPLSEYTETVNINYRLQANGKRYKLDMCKHCRKEYNAEKKREQREREQEAIEAAKEAGEDVALIPVQEKAPLKSMLTKGGVRRIKV